MHTSRRRNDPGPDVLREVGLPVGASERASELFGGHTAPVRRNEVQFDQRSPAPAGGSVDDAALPSWRKAAEDAVYLKRTNDDLGIGTTMPHIAGASPLYAQEIMYKSMAGDAGRAQSMSPVRRSTAGRNNKLHDLQRRMETLDSRVEELLSDRRRENIDNMSLLHQGLPIEARTESAGGMSARSSPSLGGLPKDGRAPTAPLEGGRTAGHRPGRTLRPLDLARVGADSAGPGPGSARTASASRGRSAGDMGLPKTARGRLESLNLMDSSLPFRDDVAELTRSINGVLGDKALGGTMGKTGKGLVPGAGFDDKGGRRGEGGEERGMGWVRRMVQFVENNPVVCVRKDKLMAGIPIMGQGAGTSADGADGAAPPRNLTDELGLPLPETMIFPSLNPKSRQDVLLLENWLADMLGCVDIQLPSGNEGDQADAAMWLYRLAFEELRRQVEASCRERGQLLGRVWSHFFVIVEMRAALRYEDDMCGLARELSDERQRSIAARDQIESRVKDTGAMEASFREKIAKLERELAKLSKRTVRAEQDYDKARADMKEMNQRMLEAIHSRQDTEEELQRTQEALEEQRLIAEESLLEAAEHRKISKGTEEILREKEKLLGQKIERLENAERAIKYLETEREEMRQEKARVDDALAREQRARSHLQAELDNKNAMMASQVERETALQEQVDRANSDKAELSAKIEKLETELANSKEGRYKTEVMYDKLHEQHEQTLYDLEKLEKSTGESRKRLEEEMTEMGRQMAELEGEIFRQCEVITNHERDKERSSAEMDRLKMEVAEVKQFCRRYDQLMEDERRHALTEGGGDHPLLKGIPAAKRHEMMSNSPRAGTPAGGGRAGDEWGKMGKAGKPQKVLAEMERGFKDMVKALESARHNEEVMRLRFEAGEKHVREMEERMYDEKMELQRLRQQLSGTSREGDKTQQHLDEERAKVQELEAEIHATKMSLHDARLHIKELETRVEKVDSLEVANKDLQEKLHEITKEAQKEKLKHEGAETMLAAKESLIDKEAQEMRQQQTRSGNLVEQIDYLSRHVTSKVSQLEETKTEMQQLQSDSKAEKERLEQIEIALSTANAGLEQQLAEERDKSATLQARLLKAAELLQLSRFWLQGLREEENFEDVLSHIDRVTKDVRIPAVTPPVWMYQLKIGILSASHHVLRVQLAQEIHRRLSNEARLMQDALSYEKKLATAIKERYAMEREVLSTQHAAVKQLQKEMRQMKSMSRKVQKHTRNVMERLVDWDTKFENRQDMATQATPDDIIMSPMSDFLAGLRPDWPPNTNSERGRARARTTIVQVYNSYLAAVAEREEVGVEDDGDFRLRMDTVFDALRVTFASLFADGDNEGGAAAWGAGADEHMADFCRGLRALLREDPKALLFARFMGVEADRQPLGRPTFTFFMTVLDCLRRLLGASWRPLMLTWEQGQAAIPRACVQDLLCNLYNTNDPDSLPLSRRIGPMLEKGSDEVLMMDLDKLLLILVGEYENQQCPLEPLRSPRRAPEVKYVYAPLGVNMAKLDKSSSSLDGTPMISAESSTMFRTNVDVVLDNMKRKKDVFDGIEAAADRPAVSGG